MPRRATEAGSGGERGAGRATKGRTGEALITAITAAARPAGFVRVRAGRSTVALLHPAERALLDVREGQALTDETLAALGQAAARSRARLDAERLLARRPLLAAELSARLANKGHEPAAVLSVVNALTAAGAVDDARLAADAARASLSRRRARAAVIAGLESRGVDSLAAARAVTGAESDAGQTDRDRALAFARSRLRPSLLALDKTAQHRRLGAALARRGYGADLVESVLGEVLGEAGDGDA